MRHFFCVLTLVLLATTTFAGGRIEGQITYLGPYSGSAAYYWIHVKDSALNFVDSLRVNSDSSYITSDLLAGTYSVYCSLWMRNDSFLASEVRDSILVVNSDTTICNFDFSQKIISLFRTSWGALKTVY